MEEIVERAAKHRVLLASPRGFCAGVERAVVAVEEALCRYGAPIYVFHEIVHNKYIVEKLKRRGAIFVDHTRDVPEGSIILLSAHGVAPTIYAEANQRNLITIDATCPLVTKVHKEVVRFAKEGFEIFLIGHEGHEEVIGTSGEAPESVTLVDGPSSADTVTIRDNSKVVWLSQTTLSVDETLETVRKLEERFPNLIAPPSDDICYATQNRQIAVKAISAQADIVIVIGSKNSSNSGRLVEVALGAGAGKAYLVDSAAEIDEDWLLGVETVGLTSGASVPEILVEEVIRWLSQRGFSDVELVSSAVEHQRFALPRELLRARDRPPRS